MTKIIRSQIACNLQNFLSEKTPKTILILSLVFFALPSGNFHIFNGLPFSNPIEYTLLLLILPFVFNRNYRLLYKTVLDSLHGTIWRILLLVSLLGLVLKIAIVVLGVDSGFYACYQSLVPPSSSYQCERSYENFSYRYNVTRIDKRLDFTSYRRGFATFITGSNEYNIENWHLAFFNSSELNFDPEVPGNISRGRLPFSVHWGGKVDNLEDQKLVVIYSGEGKIILGNETVDFPATYTEFNTIEISVQESVEYVDVFYKFDDGYRTGDANIPGPYARLSINRLFKSGETIPLSASKPNISGQIAGSLIDIFTVIIASSFLPIYFHQLKKHSIILLPLATLVTGAIKYKWLIQGIPQVFNNFILAALLSFIFYTRITKKSGKVMLAYIVFLAIAFLRVYADIGDVDQVLYHSAGDDWLTYESFGRDILETGTLEAGEAIFYYQPFIRYLKFIEHIIHGDGDGISAISTLAMLNFFIFYFFYKLINNKPRFEWQGIWVLTTEVLIFLLINLPTISKFVYKDASEVPTWIFLPLTLTLLLYSQNTAKQTTGVILLGFSAITRINHLPAILFVFFVFTLILLREKKQQTIRIVIFLTTLLMILLLPLAHNLYFGGQPVIFTTSQLISNNLNLPLDTWVNSIFTPSLRPIIWQRISDIFYFTESTPSHQLQIAFHGLQFIWSMSIITCIFFRKHVTWASKLLILLPMLYLGVHFIYQVNVYYPRHIITGHMAMGLTASFLIQSTSISEKSHKYNQAPAS